MTSIFGIKSVLQKSMRRQRALAPPFHFRRWRQYTNGDISSTNTTTSIGSMSVKELRELISKNGLTYTDCFEKSDLVKRASEAITQKATASRRIVNNQDLMIHSTRRWLDEVVLGFNLCPYAKLYRSRIAIEVIRASAHQDIVYRNAIHSTEIVEHMNGLVNRWDSSISSKLLILEDPIYANESQFDNLLLVISKTAEVMQLTLTENGGPIHIVPFHPKKLRKDVDFLDDDSPLHFSCRSPWPTINLIQEVDIENAEGIWKERFPEQSRANDNLLQRLEENNMDPRRREEEIDLFDHIKDDNETMLMGIGAIKLEAIMNDITTNTNSGAGTSENSSSNN